MTNCQIDTAVHEAGHAVAHVRLNIEQGQISIVANSQRLGGVQARGTEHVSTADEARDQVLAYCAGYAALVAAGRDAESARAGAEDDFDIAEGLIESWGLSGDLAAWMEKAVELMSESLNVAAVRLVSERVLKHQTLPEDIVDLLVDLSDGSISEDKFNNYLALSNQESFSALP